MLANWVGCGADYPYDYGTVYEGDTYYVTEEGVPVEEVVAEEPLEEDLVEDIPEEDMLEEALELPSEAVEDEVADVTAEEEMPAEEAAVLEEAAVDEEVPEIEEPPAEGIDALVAEEEVLVAEEAVAEEAPVEVVIVEEAAPEVQVSITGNWLVRIPVQRFHQKRLPRLLLKVFQGTTVDHCDTFTAWRAGILYWIANRWVSKSEILMMNLKALISEMMRLNSCLPMIMKIGIPSVSMAIMSNPNYMEK